MARTKGARSTRNDAPSLVQDHTGLEPRISNTIIGEFIAPLEERVSIIEKEIGGITSLARGTIYELLVPLRRGGRGGTTTIELPLPVVDDGVGRPLVVVQAPTKRDDDEGGIVLFTGSVSDRWHLRLHWFCAFPAPKQVKVVYLIG